MDIRSFWSHLKLAAWLLRPRTLFLRRSSKGLGDNLLLSMLLPGLRLRHPGRRIVVETQYPDLFLHNPHVAWATRAHLSTTRRHLKPRYRVLPGQRHNVYAQFMASVGLTGYSAPELFLQAEELSWARRQVDGAYVCVSPTGKQSFSGNRKEWGVDRFQQLVHHLQDQRFVQIGSPSDPLLEGVIDQRGLPIRECAAILAQARALVALEGGLVHLAKAVNTPTVAIFGGLLAQESFAHPGHLVLDNPISCSPCFSSEASVGDCPTLECLKGISVERVAAALRTLLETPLPS